NYKNGYFASINIELEKCLNELEGKTNISMVNAHMGMKDTIHNVGVATLAEKFNNKVDAFLDGHIHYNVNIFLSTGLLVLNRPPISNVLTSSKLPLRKKKAKSS
ncbi:MAG: hypothetical protein HUJ51_03600, partial [Eggerthellaceae bacterium]|nr:hypothetical protein [Eggerthellaceae bacterium]